MKYFFIRDNFHNPFPFKRIVLLPSPSDSIAIDWFVFQNKGYVWEITKNAPFLLATNFHHSFSTLFNLFCMTLKEKYWLASQSWWFNTPPEKRSMTHSQSYPWWTCTVSKTWILRSCALSTAPFFALPVLPVGTPWWKQKCTQWLLLHPFKLSLLTGTALWIPDTDQLLVPFLRKLSASVWKVMSLRLQLQWEHVNHMDFSTVTEFVFQGTV